MDAAEYWEDNWANRYTDKGADPSLFVKKIVPVLKKYNIKNILDFGSGKGRDSFFLHKLGYQMTALDISPSALVHVAAIEPAIKCICADIEDYDLGENKYDAVLSNLSLHYWDDADTKKIAAKLKRTLKPGGVLCITCKSTNDKFFGEGTQIGENIFKEEHIRHFFSMEYMREILKDCEIISLIENVVEEPHYSSYTAIEAIARKEGK